jgi:hypothetical protein
VEYLLGALAVYMIWMLIQTWISAPEWAWYVFVAVLGIITGLIIDADAWYWGIGIAGASVLVRRVDDLLLVTADRVRVDVLRNTRR